MTESFLIRLELTRTEKMTDGYRHYQALLNAHSSSGVSGMASGMVGLPSESSLEIDGTGVKLGAFIEEFRSGVGRVTGGGLQFGRWLYSRLFGEHSALCARWEAARKEMEGAKLPLRLEISFPYPSQRVGSEICLEELPFELLADEHSLLFQNDGYTLVRCYAWHTKKTFEVPRGARALLAWANPKHPNFAPIPSKDIDGHVAAFKELEGHLGWQVAPPCGHATEEELKKSLGKAKTPILSIVAHGMGDGGVLLLESADGTALSLEPRTLAKHCRDAGVELAMLWTCHSATWRPDIGSLAEWLLHQTKGNVTAVIAAHGRLETSATATLVRALLESFASSERDLDRALFAARAALKPNDIQWAIPVYYARPDSGRSVKNPKGPAEFAGSPRPTLGLQNAPSRPAHFTGREQLLSQGLELFRREKEQVRIVSVVGGPGIGKTAMVWVLADKVMKELDIQRAQSISADSKGARELRAHIALRFLDQTTYKREDYEDDVQLAQAIGETPLLLVFDSAEVYLWNAKEEESNRLFRELLDVLLTRCPHLRVLLSTQEALGTKTQAAQEEVLQVTALSDAAAQSLFFSLAGYGSPEAVGLEERGILEDILKELSGHPRALTLVAGQLKVTKSGDVLASLRSGNLDSITIARTSPSDESAARDDQLTRSFNLAYNHLWKSHRPVAEAFAWMGKALPAGASYRLLKSLFQGEDWRTVPVLQLENLVDDEDGARLFIPSPLNTYARGKAALVPQQRSDELLGRALAAYAEWLTAARGLLGTPQGPQALKETLADTSNIDTLSQMLERNVSRLHCGQLFSSWAHLMLSTGRSSRVLTVMNRVLKYLRSTDWNFRWISGLYYRSGRLTAALLKRKPAPRTEPLAQVLEALGLVYARMDEHQNAKSAYHEALWRYRSVEDSLGEANVHKALGDLHARSPPHHGAEAAYLQALRLYQRLGAYLGEAETQQSLGELYSRQEHRLEDACTAHTRARALFQQAGSELGEAHSYRLLGNLQSKLLRHTEAEAAYDEALRLYRQLEWHLGVAVVCKDLGDLHLKTHAWQKAEEYLSEALQAYGKVASHRGEAATLQSQGELFRRQSKLDLAQQALADALSLFQQLGDRSGQAYTLQSQGALFRRQSKLDLAQQALADALSLFQQLGDRSGQASTLQSQGELFRRQDKLDLAQQALADALSLFQQLGDRSGQASTLQSQGALFRRQSKLDLAQQALADALSLFQQLGDRSGQAYTLQSQGELFQRQDKLDLAQQALADALSRFQQLGDRYGQAYTLQSQGELFRRQSKLDLAQQALADALSRFQQLGDRYGQAYTLQSQGDLFRRQSKLDLAQQALADALSLFQQLGDRSGQASTLQSQGDLFRRQSKLDLAQQALADALSRFQQLGDRSGQAYTLQYQGALFQQQSKLDLAQQALADALSLFQQLGDRSGQAYTLQSQGALFRKQSKLDLAQQALADALSRFQQLGDRSGQAYTLQSQGDLFQQQSKLDLAQQALADALSLFQQLGDRYGQAYTLQSQGALFRRQSKLDLAQQALADALSLFQQLGDHIGLVNTLVSQGELFTKQGRLQDAEAASVKALHLSRDIDYPWGPFAALGLLTEIIPRRGAVRADVTTLEAALRLHRQTKNLSGEIQVLKALGELESHEGHHAGAYDYFLQALSLAEQLSDRADTADLYIRAGKSALSANLPEYGLSWSSRALDLLSVGRSEKARLLRVPALQLLADCARRLDHPVADEALRAAWHFALGQNHPDAPRLEAQLAAQVPAFNPNVRPTPEELESLSERLTELMRSHDRALVLRGINVRRPFGATS